MAKGWRIGRTAVAAGLALALAGCGMSKGPMKILRALSPVALVRQRPGQTPVKQFDEAKGLFLRGDFGQAATAFESWTIAYAGNALEPAALYYLGNSQFQTRRPKAAKRAYEQVVRLYPDGDWARFAREDLMLIASGAGYVPLARPKLRWWHPLDWFTPDPPTVVRFKEGRSLFDRSRYDEALVVFRSLGERHPKNPLAPAAWHYVGRCYERTARIQKARDAFGLIAARYKGSHWEIVARDDLERIRED